MNSPDRPLRRPRPCPWAATLISLAVVGLGACSELKAKSSFFAGPSPTSPRASPLPPDGSVALQPLAPVRRDIFTRSYRLGESYTVRTGEPVVSIKNYAVTEKVGHATVLRDFAQNCQGRWPRREIELCEEAPLNAVRGAMGSVFDVVAAVSLADGQYFAVALPSDGRSRAYVLVDPTGRLRRGSYVAWREKLSPGSSLGNVPMVEVAADLALEADVPLFSFESVERFVFMGPGYLSFDLIFTGTRDTIRGERMTFNYREFGRDSAESPAFERSLQFPVHEHVIELERLRIEVEPVGYSELRFRVIADGQPAAPLQ